jgi:hypothetical protein
MRSADVTFRRVGGDYLLVNGVLKQYHILNSVAGRIWDLLTGEHTVQEIAQTIASEYGEDADRVRQDVIETLDGLQSLQLVTIDEG